MAEGRTAGQAWLAVAAWLAVQLTLTSLPGYAVPSIGFDAGDIAHVGMYAVLAALVARAGTRSAWPPARFRWVIPAIVAFAAFDEAHQAWIPGREPSLLDFACDSVGAVGGLALSLWLLRTRRAAWLR